MEEKEQIKYKTDITKQAEQFAKEDRLLWNKTWEIYKEEGEPSKDYSIRNERRIAIYKKLKGAKK